MKKATIPYNDKERISKLNEYKILDTLPEKVYDDITFLASYICNTPIPLITFIDESRQVFKSSHGIKTTHNSREYGFCAHGINTEEDIFIINDANKDDRFYDHPMVTGNPNISFYAGVPLVDLSGFILGTLCVIDSKPRVLNDEQKNALKSLSGQVIQLLDLRKKNYLLTINQNKLEHYAKEMESFAFMASHDIKEPVRMISGFIEKLEKKYNHVFDEKALQYIKYISVASKRVTHLIEDLLDYAQIDSDEVVNEIIDINLIIEEIKNNHQWELNEKGGSITYDQMPKISGLKAAVKLLFQNLVSNGIKYMHVDAKPHIKISVIEQLEKWEFAVSDNGIGINLIYHEKIFDLFKRLHNREEYSGTGMGLAICKKIVDKHGGAIWVKSEEGIGSTFYFTLMKKKSSIFSNIYP
ncbi:MAG: GAF domain-containing protein [Bacteroidia bacterium]|nr:GAF domain-containing protein [Bacteroidia bacterium]